MGRGTCNAERATRHVQRIRSRRLQQQAPGVEAAAEFFGEGRVAGEDEHLAALGQFFEDGVPVLATAAVPAGEHLIEKDGQRFLRLVEMVDERQTQGRVHLVAHSLAERSADGLGGALLGAADVQTTLLPLQHEPLVAPAGDRAQVAARLFDDLGLMAAAERAGGAADETGQEREPVAAAAYLVEAALDGGQLAGNVGGSRMLGEPLGVLAFASARLLGVEDFVGDGLAAFPHPYDLFVRVRPAVGVVLFERADLVAQRFPVGVFAEQGCPRLLGAAGSAATRLEFLDRSREIVVEVVELRFQPVVAAAAFFERRFEVAPAFA